MSVSVCVCVCESHREGRSTPGACFLRDAGESVSPSPGHRLPLTLPLSPLPFQWPGSRLTPTLGTGTSFYPTTTRRPPAAATMTGWCWARRPSPRACTTGNCTWTATTTTRTPPSGWPGPAWSRTRCWARTTRPGPCTWTASAAGSCTAAPTPTGARAPGLPIAGLRAEGGSPTPTGARAPGLPDAGLRAEGGAPTPIGA